MGLMTPDYNPYEGIQIRRNARAKRLSLRVSRLDGRVTLTLPSGVSDRQARAFLKDKGDWIEQARLTAATPVEVAIGASLPIEGRVRTIEAGYSKSARLEGTRMIAPERGTGVAIRAWVIERGRP